MADLGEVDQVDVDAFTAIKLRCIAYSIGSILLGIGLSSIWVVAGIVVILAGVVLLCIVVPWSPNAEETPKNSNSALSRAVVLIDEFMRSSFLLLNSLAQKGYHAWQEKRERAKKAMEEQRLQEEGEKLSRLAQTQQPILDQQNREQKIIDKRQYLLQNLQDPKFPIPAISCEAELEPGEECYWYHVGAVFASDGDLRGPQSSIGTLILTDQRIVFCNKDGYAPELSIEHIIQIQANADELRISGKSKSATGAYWTQDIILFEAFLRAAIRVAKDVYAPQPEGSRSRHIAESVKRKVFKRDKGQCVYCGWREELHFDHVIPFSRGGANTIENIQLLCKRCNLTKSDDI
ncbi:MAG: HNH endonuclease [Planctomycetes bacterium]|nr:HNH endonuclease [Planctomycetota bacterium]NUQ35090.1 HNH endonuclease [Planctomycetaceae bacterium]